MSVGLGILLSVLALVPLILFSITKDRWNWRRILFRGGSIFLALLMLFFGVLYALHWWGSRPKKETGLWGIELGENKIDVKFKKGNPRKDVGVSDEWVYHSDGGAAWVVYFENGVVSCIRYLPFGESSYGLPVIQGIGSWSDLEDVRRKFGEGRVSRSKDGTELIISYPGLNIAFELKLNRVISVAVYDGAGGKKLTYND